MADLVQVVEDLGAALDEHEGRGLLVLHAPDGAGVALQVAAFHRGRAGVEHEGGPVESYQIGAAWARPSGRTVERRRGAPAGTGTPATPRPTWPGSSRRWNRGVR